MQNQLRPKKDPISLVKLTPSQRSLGKYLFVVVALFTLQVFLGGFTAHYTVEGSGFYGIDTTQILPYTLVRTWHLQAAMFWIAVGFLAAGSLPCSDYQWWQRPEIPKTWCRRSGSGH